MKRSRTSIEYEVLAAQSGDVEALAGLVAACQGALLRHALRHLRGREDAQDAVQDAWCTIVRGLRGLDDPTRFLPWALAIVARRAVDVVRRRGRSPEALATQDATAVVAEPQAAGPDCGTDEGQLLRQAIARLDREHRVVVELHYLEELSVHEVALVLDIPAGTVKSRLFHARQRLQRALDGSSLQDQTKE